MLPKIAIDLHLHLDGSISPSSARKLASLVGVDCPKREQDLIKLLRAPDPCHDLNDYLSVFDYPISLLRSPEAVTLAVKTLGEEMKEAGLIYCEVRFAPRLLLEYGMEEREAVEAAIQGVKESPIPMNVILCCMRNLDEENNLKTVQIAKEFLNKGVVALDLAGAEGLFDTMKFKGVFARARELGVPFTIHAGEADGPASVKEALSFGAGRIGHGVRSVEDHGLMEELKKRQVLLELCPTSEAQTHAIESFTALPIKEFMNDGIPVTICADDAAVSDTNAMKELELVHERLGLTVRECQKTILDGIRHSFANPNLKERLIEQVDKAYGGEIHG